MRRPDYDRDREEWGPRRPTGGFLGGRLELAKPQGEFGDYVESGFGGNVHYIHRLDRDGLIGIRVDGEAVTYGYERQRVLLSPTVGGRILADLVTTNNVAFLGVGPQIGTPNGRCGRTRTASWGSRTSSPRRRWRGARAASPLPARPTSTT
jgi:hypothetical protein